MTYQEKPSNCSVGVGWKDIRSAVKAYDTGSLPQPRAEHDFILLPVAPIVMLLLSNTLTFARKVPVYALALKGNQGTLFDYVVLLLDDAELKASTAAAVVEADHGRIETRTAMVSTEIDWLQKQHQWPGLKAIGKVCRLFSIPQCCRTTWLRRSGDSTRLSR